jgi:HPt (histidine-containing phosphotransfer) domain-containing protein
MDGYVPNPFKQPVLLETIKTVLNPDYKLTRKRRVNLSFIDEMACGDLGFRKDMINLFIEKIPAEEALLEEAFKNNDYLKVKNLAHNMRSSMDMFMLDDLSNCLAVIEEEARNEKFSSEAAHKAEIFHCGIIEVVKYLKEL